MVQVPDESVPLDFGATHRLRHHPPLSQGGLPVQNIPLLHHHPSPLHPPPPPPHGPPLNVEHLRRHGGRREVDGGRVGKGKGSNTFILIVWKH